MSKEIEAKLDVLKRTHLSLGKITDVWARLALIGEDALAEQVDTRRLGLLEQIERLQGQIAIKWDVPAIQLTQVLSETNTKVQTQTRNIRNNVNITSSAVKILGLYDRSLSVLKMAGGGSRDHD